ncbi:MAG: phospholipase D-like domain-containing protein [Bdellovibrio sp.]
MIKSVFLIFLISLTACSLFQSRETSTMNREVANQSLDNGTQNKDIYPYRVTSNKPHDMRIINNGMAAFYQRIDMIRRAKKSLDLEYFIFNPDTAGRITMQELIKAAERGVEVRILVDKSVAVFALDEYYAMILRDHGIQLRYYNPAPTVRISSVQFRNHRKLIVRDDEEAITGGRNIADEYFNLSKEFNFLDRDVWIRGEIVRAMKDTFELYWKSDIVEIPLNKSKPLIGRTEYIFKMSEAKSVLWRTPEENHVLAFAMDFGKKALLENNIYQCPEVSFATDREGASFIERVNEPSYERNFRYLKKEIGEWMGKVSDEVILDSPYFLKDRDSEDILEDLLRQNKKVTIFTNSLASTDAVYVSTVFNDTVKQYTDDPNFNAYIYKGKFSFESKLYSDEILKSDWGTHSKTILFNDNSFMIGTYNIDHRSNFYNTEMALFCSGSPELAKDVKNNIQLRMKSSHHLNKDGRPDDGSPLLGGNPESKKRLYYFLKIPATIGQFLL